MTIEGTTYVSNVPIQHTFLLHFPPIIFLVFRERHLAGIQCTPKWMLYKA